MKETRLTETPESSMMISLLINLKLALSITKGSPERLLLASTTLTDGQWVWSPADCGPASSTTSSSLLSEL
jgi:hypothetical protein